MMGIQWNIKLKVELKGKRNQQQHTFLLKVLLLYET